MDEIFRTVFAIGNEPEQSSTDPNSTVSSSDDTMPGLEPIATTDVRALINPSIASGNVSGPSVTGDSGSGLDVDVEMVLDSQPTNTRETRTPLESSASSPLRPNRRARVEVDEDVDVDRDRRHPSHRTIDILPGAASSLNENVGNIGNGIGNSARTQPPRPQTSTGTPRLTLPILRFTPVQPGVALGASPGSGEPVRGFLQVFDDMNAARPATINSTALGLNNIEAGGMAGRDPGTTNPVAPSPVGGPTRSFSTGLSIVFDSNGNAFTTRLRRFATQANSPIPPNVNPGQAIEPEASQAVPPPGPVVDTQTATTIPLRDTQDGFGAQERVFGDTGELSMGAIGQTLHVLGHLMTTGLGLGLTENEDPEKAMRLIAGLEEVPEGLVRRLERIGGAPGGLNGAGATENQAAPEGCAICLDKLLGGKTDENDWNDKGKARETEGEVGDSSVEENAMANSTNNLVTQDQSTSSSSVTNSQEESISPAESTEKKSPKIVCLPCAHVFHASCLKPWFSRPRQTTCPTCRFNIDPENLTSRRTIRLPRRAAANNSNNSNVNSNSTAIPTAQANESTPASGPVSLGAGDGATAPQPGQPPAGFAQFSAHPEALPSETHAHMGALNRPGEQAFVLGIDLVFGFPPSVDPASGSGMPTGQMDMNATGGPTVAQPTANQAGEGNSPANPQLRREMSRMEQEFAMIEAEALNALRLLERRPPAPTPPFPTASLASTASPLEVNRNNGTSSTADSASDSAQPPLVNLGNPPSNLPPGSPTTGPGVAGQLPNFAQMFGSFFNLATAHRRAPNSVPPTATELGPQTESGTTAPAGEGTTPNAPQPNAPQNSVGGPDVSFGFHAVPFPVHFNLGRGPIPQRPPRARKEWTLPPAPGLTLRQRVEQKERDLGVRCHDVSCGIGPSDEDPEAESDITKRVRQLAIRPFGKSKEATERVCAHTFHGPCLVTAQRVALRGAEECLKDGEVEVSCPVCRESGCLLKEEWDEGVQAL